MSLNQYKNTKKLKALLIKLTNCSKSLDKGDVECSFITIILSILTIITVITVISKIGFIIIISIMTIEVCITIP